MAQSEDSQGRDGSLKPSNSPYQLDLAQTTKACRVLQQHIDHALTQRVTKTKKRDLLSKSEDDVSEPKGMGVNALASVPLWMVLTGKKHITDRTRLKPNKIHIPHSLYTENEASICLITADPQRLYKDVIAQPSFPAALRSRITRVIGLEKLKARYKSYESKRQLASDHALFLADSRIWTYLPRIMGKTFFQSGSKRPIPVEVGGPRKQKLTPGQTRNSTKGTDGDGAAGPEAIAQEVEMALKCAVIHLSTSSTTAVKVGTAAMAPDQCSANIQAVVNGMTSRLLPRGWRNVRAIHIKGPNTPALPIWLASELWEDETAVVAEQKGAARNGHGKRKRNASEVQENLRTPNRFASSKVRHSTADSVRVQVEDSPKQRLKKLKTDVLADASDG